MFLSANMYIENYVFIFGDRHMVDENENVRNTYLLKKK